MHQSTETPPAGTADFYRRFRHGLARVRLLQSGYMLLRSIREAMHDSPIHGQEELNQEFEPHDDPWNYATASYQRDRIHREVTLLDAVRGNGQFKQALEVGCAEGIFTEDLAPRCESLLAVDISSVALERARRRLQGHKAVHFALWDLRVDPVPEAYDLIVIIHALEYIRNPVYVHRARTKLVNSLRPGGHLLVGTMRVADIYEEAWWGRFMLRSGKRINSFFAGHPALKLVQTEEIRLGPDYVAYDVLLQKKF